MAYKNKYSHFFGLTVIIIFSFLLVGCTTLKIGTELANPKLLVNEADGTAKKRMVVPYDNYDTNLVIAATEIGLIEPASFKSIKSTRKYKIFPDWMKQSSFAKKVVGNSLSYSVSITAKDIKSRSGRPQSFKIENYTTKELKNFAELSFKMSGLFKTPAEFNDTLINVKPEKTTEKSLYDDRLLYYLVAYFEGKYIDRSGVAFPKPKFSSAIGNDTIVPLITISLDSFYDSIYNIPVFYEDKDSSFAPLNMG